MAFEITISADADSQLRQLPVRDQRVLETAIQRRLSHRPTAESRAIKRLRPNSLVEFELRVGDLRVLYNVEGLKVVILVVGRKVRETLVVKGEVFHGH